MGRKIKNLAGQRSGRLLVLNDSGKKIHGNVVWTCLCDCGKFVTVSSNHLVSKHTRSCGCLQRDHASLVGKASFKHGDSGGINRARLYRIRNNMKQRCSNGKNADFKRYGGRGVSVCGEWKASYVAFRSWALANGYADNLTIDRIDNDEGYYPENCQWITKSENSRKGSGDK